MKLQVIVEETSGEVVATQQIVSPDYRVPAQWSEEGSHVVAVYRRIAAGPGQRSHEVEVDVPDDVLRAADVERFHSVVKSAVDRTAG